MALSKKHGAEPGGARRSREHVQQAAKHSTQNLRSAVLLFHPVTPVQNFIQVHMLYVDMEVNGVHVKAFIDSGAQVGPLRSASLHAQPDRRQ